MYITLSVYVYILYINRFFPARNLIPSQWARLITYYSLSRRAASITAGRMINRCGNRALLSSLITCKDSSSRLSKLRFHRQFVLINWRPTGTMIGSINTTGASRYKLDRSLRKIRTTQIASGIDRDVKLIVSKLTKTQIFFS